MSARSIPIQESPKEETALSARKIDVSDKDISRFRSLISAPIKGIAKSSLGLGKLAYILTDPTGKFKEYAEPLFEKAEQKIEENIPTHPETLEKGLERAGGIFGGLVLSGGLGGGIFPTAGRAALGGAGGQLVEELGGGPVAQSAAEIGFSSLPSLARRIIPSSADQSRILETGRRYGMTEEQLAPLMPESRKRRFFGRSAYASEGSEEALRETRQGIGNIYNTLESSPIAQQALSPQAANRFVNQSGQIMRRLPANVRNQVQQDAQDLFNAAQQRGGFTGDELINWYRDVSSRYNLGRAELEQLKNPIREALNSINPNLGRDFETANRMWQKQAQIGRVLRPSEYEHIISLGEAYELGASAANLDAGRLTRLLGVVGYRKFSEQMLTNPRLQNIIEKTQDALLNNNINMLGKLGDLLFYELKDEDQE